MHVHKSRRHLCAVCKKGTIVESVLEKTEDGKIQVHFSSHSHTHSEYKVFGGRLLKDHPRIPWSQKKDEKPVSLGGICNTCIESDPVQRLLLHINLAPNK